jgi:hypothetical protein
MKFLAVCLFLICAWASAMAESPGASSDVFRPVIQHQLEAIARDDGAAAYDDASPTLHQMFPSAEIFMSMVKNGYPMVYRNKRYVFEDAGTDATGRPFQLVQIQAEDGVIYEAIYYMQQQTDGSWKISGCIMAKTKGGEA